MNAIKAPKELSNTVRQVQRAATANQPTVLTDIYRADINIAIWQRSLIDALAQEVKQILITKPALQASFTVTPDNAYTAIHDTLGSFPSTSALAEDIARLVDMFCCLFDLQRAGLRLTSLDHAMCPRFHVDQVPCRLVTTYQGMATQWLAHHAVNRSKLGAGNQGKPDEQSGLFDQSSDIQQLTQGDVALLKGERWEGNENAGLVHRSPLVRSGQNRLLMTLDFMN